MIVRVAHLVCLPFLAGCFLSSNPLATATRAAAVGPLPIEQVYSANPSTEAAIDGMFATGAAFADLNGDQRPDLVVANGNDMSPQPLTVYYNQCAPPRRWGCFDAYPSWYSEDFDYQGKLSVGDIDHDGWLDVAVAMPFNRQRRIAGGGVKIYMNRRGVLEGTPSVRIAEGFGVFDCNLADVNADGRLDLVVAALADPSLGAGETQAEAIAPVRAAIRAAPLALAAESVVGEPARIYLNENGRLHTTSDWRSQQPIFALGVVSADINQDGWMDLAFAGGQVLVFYGSRPVHRGVPIATAPAWTSAPEPAQALFLDAGRVGDGDGLALAASRMCFGAPGCDDGFALYRPAEGREPVWTSARADLSSMALLADVNADGLLDLIAGQWGDMVAGAALWFFQGRAEGFSTEPDFQTVRPGGPSGFAVAEGLAVADTRSCAVTARTWSRATTGAGAVITLPERRLHAVTSVSIDGRRLDRAAWTAVPEQNWISVSEPFSDGETVEIEYAVSPVQDLFEATWNPERGNLFYNASTCH